MVGVGGCPGGDHAQQITSDDYISCGSAYALAGTFSKRIDAAGAHVAVSAAQSQFSKATLRQLFFIAVPGSLQARSLTDIEHLLAGGIHRSIANVLNHIITPAITSEYESETNLSATI
jgi:hypothetical protein